MSKPIEFGMDDNGELGLVNTPANLEAFSRVRVDLATVKSKFDEFVYDVLLMRWNDHEWDKELGDRVERRIDVAIKKHEPQIERMVREAIEKAVMERAKAIVAGMKFEAQVSITSETKEENK